MKLPGLRARREGAGLTMRELAKRAKVSLGTVNRVENGAETWPTTAAKLAAVVGATPADLMDGA